ncbi:probable palmitoyltransferase ZDHHC4 isoform X1 [Fukomys damarensis]|uniref:Palmitoyltransferase n=1 Tax=Fukomys damarensis TaxID=885580 RepID=A0A091D4A3_FUKDA|nr:probable palmitoyltransferase ZDHHC4 isoform X1 [Fukomys damarensis]XP_010641073.1 probable palmitoyltransferase ZDHHC4 isoform X1 [Fukomys damarensis]XP_033620683.1 probable palmitoyltransferase ZDHHC4 isoform X1 [Fukomys damarensis]XP_033620684.1 probable palmitoyltransferase ZDHHC4 isoform X1 [Fukomys damarensis]KFO25333.1 Putative palmitoyltransferase ZDHHC4 [Fukomys damarensis]
MDFLVLFLLYLAFGLISVVMICICSKSHHLTRLVQGGTQLCSCIIPQCLQRATQRWLHYFFHTRNHTFIVLHLVLQGLVYIEYTWEIFGYCRELEFSMCYLLLPYLWLIVNLVFFTLTCLTNPGTVTKTNELLFLQVYEFDDVMFPKNMRCSTCGLKKPARSKHCSVCNRCVHRFDHHCVWVNNCIGAWNTRYFLIYLLTLTVSAATMAILSAAFLVRLVVVSDLYQEMYIDDFGRFQAMDTVFLIQYLFLTFPRIVFLLGFVVVLSFLLGGYLCFAVYLAATNQTTNEWYKGDWAWCQHCPLVARSSSAEYQVYQNIYSQGLWNNLQEIFLLAGPCYERKKK